MRQDRRATILRNSLSIPASTSCLLVEKHLNLKEGVGTVKVVTQPNCDWTATSGTDWLQIMDGESGIGPGVITYSVEPNSTPEKRVADSTFGGKTFTVTQKGSTLP